MTNTNTAAAIATGTCFPHALTLDDGETVNPGAAIIVGRSAISGETGALATYLGVTLDGFAVVDAGYGVEEWPVRFLASLEVA